MNVSEERKLLTEAYEMGYDEFSGIDTVEEPEGFELSYFKESARWANHVAPSLRSMAGFNDRSGMGTYTEPPNDDSYYLFEELVDMWDNGAYDAAFGREKDHTRHIGSDL